MRETNSAVTAQVKRLRRAVKRSEQRLDAFRSKRVSALEQILGRWYGEAPSVEMPMNVLASAALALIAQLVLGPPKISCTGRKLAARPSAGLLALWLQKWAQESDYGLTQRLTVFDGLLGPGLTWTGLGTGNPQQVGDITMDVGLPYCDRISLDRYIVDPDAERRTAAAFEGHEAEIPLDYLLECGQYQNCGDVRPKSNDAERRWARDLGNRSDGVSQPFLEVARVMEFWLPRGWTGTGSPLSVTLPIDGQGDLPLREAEYVGPERGNYEMLSFHPVPDRLLPLPPVAQFRDLNELINRVVRKLSRQIDREKVLGIIEDSAQKEGAVIRKASDGDLIVLQNKDRVGQMQLGGASAEKFQTIQWLLQFFSKQAGNYDLWAGLDNAAPTLGQEELLAGGAGIRLDAMRQDRMDFDKRVLGRVAWYLWNDEYETVELERKVPGTDIVNPISLTPEMRAEVDVEDFDIEISAYGARPEPPEVRAGKLSAWADQQLARGAAVDVEAVARVTAELLCIDEADELLLGGVRPEGPLQSGRVFYPPAAAQGRGRITVNATPGATPTGTPGNPPYGRPQRPATPAVPAGARGT